MKEYFPILRKCPLFEQIEDEHLMALLGCLGARISFFDKKYTIFAEGTPAKHIGILLSGSAQIVRVDYVGNRSLLGEVRPSEVFGEAFACAEVASLPVTVVADEPCCVMLLDCRHILHSCSNACDFHAQIIYNLMKELAIKNMVFHQKIEVTSKRTTREKLLTYLMLQAKKAGADRFTIPFDRQELADYLEVERSGLSAEIGKMRREGLIECHKNQFALLGTLGRGEDSFF